MKYLLPILALLVFLVAGVTSVSASSYHGPRIKAKDGTSTNWSGYAAVAGSLSNPLNNVVSDVVGSWVVPSVNCTNSNTYSSAWVGIDGYNDNSVEQLGTEHDCVNGKPSYSAWYETYPKPSYNVNLVVMPGDKVSAEVKYVSNGNFVLSMTDVSTGKGFSISQKENKAQRQSAEWIMESPWSGGVLPLSNFGKIGFTNARATIGANILSPVSSFVNDQINMTSSDGTVLKASTSALTNGTDFTVTWSHN